MGKRLFRQQILHPELILNTLIKNMKLQIISLIIGIHLNP